MQLGEEKEIVSLSDVHRDDGHLEFLEVRRVSGDYLSTRERNQFIIRLLSCPSLHLSLPLSLPFLPCLRNPFYWLFAQWKLSSHCTHYRYLRSADHHHQLISYRRRSSIVPSFFLLKQRRHSSLGCSRSES